jgi:hypothetical protein
MWFSIEVSSVPRNDASECRSSQLSIYFMKFKPFNFLEVNVFDITLTSTYADIFLSFTTRVRIHMLRNLPNAIFTLNSRVGFFLQTSYQLELCNQ